MTQNEYYLSEASKAMADAKRLYQIYHKATAGIDPPGMDTIQFTISPADITAIKQEFAARRDYSIEQIGLVSPEGEVEYDPGAE